MTSQELLYVLTDSGYTLGEIAEIVGCSKIYLSFIKNGRRNGDKLYPRLQALLPSSSQDTPHISPTSPTRLKAVLPTIRTRKHTDTETVDSDMLQHTSLLKSWLGIIAFLILCIIIAVKSPTGDVPRANMVY